MTRRDVNEGDVFRKGFATNALEDGATTGQVPAIAADGQMEFVNAGGGSQPQTATHTFTLNRAGGFVDSHVFDLGSDAAFPLLVKMTMLSFTADGETLGNDPGTIYVGEGDFPLVATNSDNGPDFAAVANVNVNHFVVGAGGFVFELQDDSATPERIDLVARYVKIKPQLVANDTGATYAGANDPVASVRVDLTYSTGDAGGGSQTYLERTTVLTSAQVLALFTTPVEVIPAPGAGKFINAFAASPCLNFVTTAYDTSGVNNLSLFYGTDRTVLCEQLPTLNQDVLAATEDATASMTGMGVFQTGSPLGGSLVQSSKLANKALMLTTEANPTLGDSSLVITILYVIVDLP